MRDPEKTRAAILDAAYDQVYHRGFQTVTVDEMLNKTHLTKGAFYSHFKSKDELGYALVDEVLREMTLDRDPAPDAPWLRNGVKAEYPDRTGTWRELGACYPEEGGLPCTVPAQEGEDLVFIDLKIESV